MKLISQLFGYFFIGFAAMAALSTCYAPFYFLLRKRFSFWRQVAGFLLGVCVIVISTVTVLDQALCNLLDTGTIFSTYHRINLIPLQFLFEAQVGDANMFIQAIANLFMFLPLGFIVPIALPRLRTFWKSARAMLLFSLSIEVFQYFIGRATDIDDLLLNTLGGILGYGLFRCFSHLLRHHIWWQKLCGNDTP